MTRTDGAAVTQPASCLGKESDGQAKGTRQSELAPVRSDSVETVELKREGTFAVSSWLTSHRGGAEMHKQEGEHQEHVRDRPRRPRQVNPHRLPRLQGKRNILLLA